MILTWDPGDVRVGFTMAEYLKDERKLNMHIMRIVPAAEVFALLELAETMLKPGETHQFVVENFRNDQLIRDQEYGGRGVGGRSRGRGGSPLMFQWSEMKTSRMIGTLEYAAYRMNKSPFVLQEPGPVLGGAKRWAPFEWPKGNGHLPDDKSAYCHMAYWAMKQGMIDTTDDILFKGQEKLW